MKQVQADTKVDLWAREYWEVTPRKSPSRSDEKAHILRSSSVKRMPQTSPGNNYTDVWESVDVSAY